MIKSINRSIFLLIILITTFSFMKTQEKPLVPNDKYISFQQKFGAIPASDKNDIHKIKSRMLQGIYRKTKIEGVYCNYLIDSSCFINFMRSEKLQNDAAKELKDIIARDRLTDQKRLCNNLLSSQPLAFNLFLPLRWDNYKIATETFKKLYPDLNIKNITDIKLEFVPGDNKENRIIVTDKSCFDVFVEYITFLGQKSCIGIEVKYTEPFSNTDFNKAPDDKRKRYINAISDYSNQFYSEYTQKYLGVEFNQLFRNQLISEEVKSKTDYANCFQIVLFSSNDTKCIKAVNEFSSMLKIDKSFQTLTIEDFIKSIIDCDQKNEISKLYQEIYNRYCNYGKLEEYLQD